MASIKKLTTPVKKKPKPRATSVAKLKLGDEPTFTETPRRVELVRALNWYNACATDPEVNRSWVKQFMLECGASNEDVKSVLSKSRNIIPTFVFLARMASRKQPLPASLYDRALAYFKEFGEKESQDDLETDEKPVERTTTNKATRKIGDLVNDIEEIIAGIMQTGQTPTRRVYDVLRDGNCNAAMARDLKRAFAFQTAEYTELASKKCDPDLDEAYSHLYIVTRKRLAAFMEQLNADLDSFVQVAKATRKTRKPKPVKADKLVRHLKYKVQDDEFKIASFSPEKLIGASYVVLFNTKYRKIVWYQGAEGGLSVKGTSLQNIGSSGQKTLRKPAEQLPAFLAGTQKGVERNFGNVKTTLTEANGRINADCVLLRVFQ